VFNRNLRSAVVVLVALTNLIVHAEAEDQFCGFQCSKTSADETLSQLGALQNQSTPLACSANQNDFVKNANIADGARKAMALMYGSCDVLALPVRNLLSPNSITKGAVSYKRKSKRYISSRSKVMASHPYLNARLNSPCSDAKACTSGKFNHENTCEKNACFVINNPPLYQYGVKPKDYSVYVKTSRFTGTGDASGIDCSAYVTEAMNLTGARAYPDKNLSSGGLGTAQFWTLGDTDDSGDPKDCFERIIGEAGLKSGDLIVAPNSHIVMIDTVGKDPFGIEALLAKKDEDLQNTYRDILNEKGQGRSGVRGATEFKTLQELSLGDVLDGKSEEPIDLQLKFLNGVAETACDQDLLDPEDFKVTIAHSSPHGGHVGVQRERLFPGVGSPKGSAPMAMAMINKAKSDCVQALQSKWYAYSKKKKSEISYSLAESFGYVAALKKREDTGKGARVLRHDPNRAGCKADPAEIPQIPGNECVACCSTVASYEQMVPKNDHDSEDDTSIEEDQQ
jgi:hypothetical protein